MGLYGGPSAPSSPYGTSSFATEPRAGLTGPRPPAAPRGNYGRFNYTAALANDQILRPYLQGLNSQGNAAKAGLALTQQQLLAKYGEVPDQRLLGGYNPTQETRDLAQQATQGGASTVAQLQRAYEQQQAGDAAAAAARGLGHSGFVGQFTNQNLQDYNLAHANALDQLLSQLGQAQQGYQSTQADLRGQAATATNEALMRYIAGVKAGVYG